ncbi:RsiV family protein [Dethiothermospora halolimnae]|uniref:RsiV family protein n=1 Tax=Dethiothermospora halolimnae TaxID=3114390 RepID=UPI003CCBA3B4
MTKVKYDTIDKEKEVLITLPSLFKDDSYVDVITKNIKEQMIKENKEDEGKIYMIKEIEGDGPGEFFEKISKNQEFYINDEGKLTISFNEYEVAPGYMGVVEFTIPTEILSDILVSDKYIK